jgi:glucuronosyltransferase
MGKLILTLVFLFAFVGLGQCANILIYFVGSYSHRIAIWPLVEELANRGHKLTFLSPFPNKKPNAKIEELTPKALSGIFEGDQGSIEEKRGPSSAWDSLGDLGLMSCEAVLQDIEFQTWMKKQNGKLDLVIIDALFNECALGIAHKFGAKYIVFSTFTVASWMADLFGLVPESSWIPDIQYHYKEPMTFISRLWTTLIPLRWHYYIKTWSYYPQLEVMLRKELDLPNMPSLMELDANTSLVFLNCHHTTEYARALSPMFIPVGGIHIQDSKETLPKDVAKFMDESGPGGVVYFSFGSQVWSSNLPPEKVRIFLEVFRSLKSTRFIWKTGLDIPKEQIPPNVMLLKWAPQQAILAHKNIKVFMTHGGLLSLTEAANQGVPVIVFPLFADQDYNANIVEKVGRGVKVEITEVTIQILKNALSKILSTDAYKARTTELSKVFNDRPEKPLQTAVWWTEYVLRHESTSHLKPGNLHQTWYERRLLDVWLFILTTVLLSLSVVIYIMVKCLRLILVPKKISKEKRSHKVKRN